MFQKYDCRIGKLRHPLAQTYIALSNGADKWAVLTRRRVVNVSTAQQRRRLRPDIPVKVQVWASAGHFLISIIANLLQYSEDIFFHFQIFSSFSFFPADMTTLSINKYFPPFPPLLFFYSANQMCPF